MDMSSTTSSTIEFGEVHSILTAPRVDGQTSKTNDNSTQNALHSDAQMSIAYAMAYARTPSGNRTTATFELDFPATPVTTYVMDPLVTRTTSPFDLDSFLRASAQDHRVCFSPINCS